MRGGNTISREDLEKFDNLFPSWRHPPSFYDNNKKQYIGLSLEEWNFVQKLIKGSLDD